MRHAVIVLSSGVQSLSAEWLRSWLKKRLTRLCLAAVENHLYSPVARVHGGVAKALSENTRTL